MKTLIITTLCSLTLFLFPLTGICQDTEVRTVNHDFEGVRIEGSFDVVINDAPQDGKIKLVGAAKDLKEITVDVRHNTLVISRNKGFGLFDNFGEVKISFNAQDLQNIALSGSGKIVAQGVQNRSEFVVAMSGSGEIIANTHADEVVVAISGSGNINLTGTTDHVTTTLSGSGTLQAFNLETNGCEIVLSGSGDVKITATDYLEMSGIGSGDVYYKGHPDIETRSIGSSAVIEAN